MEAFGGVEPAFWSLTLKTGNIETPIGPPKQSVQALQRIPRKLLRSGLWFQFETFFAQLGPAVVPFYPFLGEGSPTKIDSRKKIGHPYSNLSNLEDLDNWGQNRKGLL